MNNLNISSKFVEFLSSRGIEYSITNDFFINFKYKNLNYVFQYNQGADQYYFRIMLPKINNKPIDNALKDKITKLNIEYKAVKILEYESNSVWAFMEIFVYSMNNIEMLFTRCIDLLAIVIEKYREEESM